MQLGVGWGSGDHAPALFGPDAVEGGGRRFGGARADALARRVLHSRALRRAGAASSSFLTTILPALVLGTIFGALAVTGSRLTVSGDWAVRLLVLWMAAPRILRAVYVWAADRMLPTFVVRAHRGRFGVVRWRVDVIDPPS